MLTFIRFPFYEYNVQMHFFAKKIKVYIYSGGADRLVTPQASYTTYSIKYIIKICKLIDNVYLPIRMWTGF